MANGISGWIKRLFKRERQTQWNWTVGEPAWQKTEDLFTPRITFPQVVDHVASKADKPEGKVILGFFDGSQLALDDSHPLVQDFVKVADRMTRPARWRKLFGAKVGL